jgi:hypothetical protein
LRKVFRSLSIWIWLVGMIGYDRYGRRRMISTGVYPWSLLRRRRLRLNLWLFSFFRLGFDHEPLMGGLFFELFSLFLLFSQKSWYPFKGWSKAINLDRQNEGFTATSRLFLDWFKIILSNINKIEQILLNNYLSILWLKPFKILTHRKPLFCSDHVSGPFNCEPARFQLLNNRLWNRGKIGKWEKFGRYRCLISHCSRTLKASLYHSWSKLSWEREIKIKDMWKALFRTWHLLLKLEFKIERRSQTVWTSRRLYLEGKTNMITMLKCKWWLVA